MKVKDTVKAKYDVQGEKLKSALESKGYEAYYVNSAEEAKALALKLIPENASISWGGTETMKEIGLLDEIKSGKYNVIDREKGKTPEEKDEIMRQGLLADVFLMSSNAVTKDGELVNVDGRGNRVAALCYGPKTVLMVIGMNKAVGTLDAAFDRINNTVAPVNAQRLHLETPCGVTGYCANCHGPKCICSQVVVTRQSKPQGRIKVILVGEDLGF